MENQMIKTALRWALPVVTILAAAFTFVHRQLLLEIAPTLLTEPNGHLFVSKHCALVFWSLIHFALLVYSMYQLLPAQRNKFLFDRLSAPLIFANMLSIAWMFVHDTGMVGLSAMVSCTALINAWIMLSWVRSRILDCSYNAWIGIPFSLYAGWMTIMSLGNFTEWLGVLGWYHTTSVPALLLVVSGGVMGVTISLKYKDWIYPAAIAWVLTGIWYTNIGLSPFIAWLALAGGITMAMWSIGYAIATKSHLYDVV